MVGVGCAVILGCAAPAAATYTITTTYVHNSDGAPTAMTRQVGSGAPATTYFLWDNFIPNATDPSTGTVRAGNGNLLGSGPRLSAAGLSTQFTYDRRNRLISCRAGAHPTVRYTYHPAGVLSASTLPSGDALRFYYDNSSAAQVTNQRQSTTGMVAGFLGPLRYLDDGTEQVLVTPRKDTAVLYEPAAEAVTPYTYEPYGTPRTAGAPPTGLSSDATRYDLAPNPFLFGGEYWDGACGAYYQRARWYLPAAEIFTTRDLGDPVHRFNAFNGDPTNLIDPSGLSARGYRDYQAGVNRIMKKLGPWGSTALSVVPILGPAMFLVQASAMGEFWHNRRDLVMFSYMVVAAGTAALLQSSGVDRLMGASQAFGLRLGTDIATGSGQSALGAVDERGRFEWSAFGENIGFAAVSILAGRAVGGFGYRPFNMSPRDVDAMAAAHFGSGLRAEDAGTLVFRVRYKASIREFTTPWMEYMHIANTTHEGLIAVGTDHLLMADRGHAGHTIKWSHRQMKPSEFLGSGKKTRELQFVGTFDSGAAHAAFSADTGYSTQFRSGLQGKIHIRTNDYNRYTNNCQHYSAHILASIRAHAAVR
jgi:RHS repeat-associated protein